jgi:hypothetical protein
MLRADRWEAGTRIGGRPRDGDVIECGLDAFDAAAVFGSARLGIA